MTINEDNDDMGDFWRDVSAFRQAKRWSNLENSTGIMERSGVPFVSKNNGVHLIVADRWDFWPSTGLFVDRRTQKRGRGVKNLLRYALCRQLNALSQLSAS